MTITAGQRDQLSFDDVAPRVSLQDVTFVVVDLETTGGSAEQDAITEIGAVKVRGGEVIGEFATLVDPQRGIPPSVVAMTGITELMVADAPRLESVLPSFMEFAAHSVLVAHNASFDVGFLRANSERFGLAWQQFPVICTARLARRVLTRDETPNYKLGTLAKVLHARTTPVHRALDDARATVDVLHALLERVGSLSVQTLDDLLDHLRDRTPQQRRKRGLADSLPNGPGVYLFRGPNDEVLYVGTSSDLRRRVRQYFTAGERRGRIREMVALADRVDHVLCAHPLEAEVRELRLLAAHQPRYNRRSKFPRRAWWVVLTDEPFPRLAVVRRPKGDAFGPFSSRRAAASAVDALQSSTMVRHCTQRLSARRPAEKPCALFELGRCGAPCAGHQSVDRYAVHVAAIADLLQGHDDAVLEKLRIDIEQLSDVQRYEDAGARRDRLAALVRVLDRGQRLSALAVLPEVIAARPDGSGGWHLAVIRYARLAAAGTASRGVPPMPVVDQLQASAETIIPDPGPLRGAPVDEARAVYGWLTTGGTRLVRCERPWTEPAMAAAGAWQSWLRKATAAHVPYAGVD